MTTKLTPVGVAWDAWMTQRSGSALVTRRQRERLAALVAHARARSPFYAEHYDRLSAGLGSIEDLPSVTKLELMDRFDDWVTDPEVRRSDLERWIGDLSHLGQDYLGRYLICTTLRKLRHARDPGARSSRALTPARSFCWLRNRRHIQPAFLGSAGETLTFAARQQIESAFACAIIDLYNATEVNGSTFVCRDGAMHYSADWFIFERIDDHQRPVPLGAPSYSLPVTNLANYVQPIIRYEIG
jgi:hypothetical protein